MKNVILIAAAALTGFSALAGVPAPGAIVLHTLSCDVPRNPEGFPMSGVGYSLQCSTQALAPQYSLRGCTLISQVVAPKAEPKKIALAIASQTVQTAVLHNEASTIEVIVNKANMSATVNFGTAATTCKEKK